MKLFVTGAGALLGQGIIKCLRLADHPYEIVAVDPDPRAVGLFWADQAYCIPMAADPAYLPRVMELLLAEKPDALLVGTDVELLMFAENKAVIEAACGTKVIVSPPPVIKIADDKWLTYRFLADNGFPHPLSALPEEVDALLAQCDFPLVVKPRVGARSAGVHLVRDEKALAQALAQVDKAIVQESVATAVDEYTSGMVLSDGRGRAIVTMRRDLRDGNTYRAYVQPDSPFDATLLTIAERLGGDGPLNFQFRVADGVPKIFEINARFSGTTPFRTYAGFNEVDAMVRHVVLGEPLMATAVNPVVVLRYWNEIVVEAAQIENLTAQNQSTQPTFHRPDFL